MSSISLCILRFGLKSKVSIEAMEKNIREVDLVGFFDCSDSFIAYQFLVL